ncbi:MAG: DUF1819 family protein [Lachnospiraceae bacterium]|nr:DUF1819 family protein [Lachnospiraceae bacterium]
MVDYSAKTTAENFLYNETKTLASYLLGGEDIEVLKRRNITENLIMYKKEKAIARVNAPIFRRLAFLMEKDMIKDFLYEDISTSKYILLYAVMKTDNLVKDFVFEVYKKKVLEDIEYIEKKDIDDWYQEKMAMSETLKSVTVATENKLKQVILKILQDANLVNKEKNRFKIIKPSLKSTFIDLLDSKGDINFAKAIGGLV